MHNDTNGARFDSAGSTVIIDSVAISEADVVNEARHWVTGERGQRCDDPAQLAHADVTKFATEALVLGAKALSLTALTSETRALERMLREVGDKTSDATRRAAEATADATKSATETVAKAAEDAKKAMAEADETTRKHLADAVASTKKDLLDETHRLFGGENPELLERLQPVLVRFAVTLEKQVQASTSELLAKATKQLDPSDPASPMAKHAATLAQQQAQFAKQIEKSQGELAAKVDDLSTALKVQDAKASLAKVTPIKGASFEGRLHSIMSSIAAGLGDEYTDTTTTTGLVPRSKKGDGLLRVAGQDARVVIEMTDSSRANWGEYFAEAERNRGAAASLGIVRTADQNGGHAIRVLGQRRVVIAFDPETDDAEVLRTVTLLLRTVSIAASVRTGAAEIDTAEENIAEAVAHLDKIDSIKKAAGTIQKSAVKIETECTSITTSIRRLLDQALVSLAGHQDGGTNELTVAVDGAA
ncbi:hypothetical protein GCM10028820_07780 [Tessaracoccus terricola]